MIKNVFIKSIVLLLVFSSINVLFSQSKKVGTNLGGIVDWSPEFVFKDVFKMARVWTSYNADGSGPWDTGVDIPLRSDGYPLAIPYDNGVDAPQAVKALILWDLQYGYPTGSYTLELKGTGTVKLSFGASGIFEAPGTYTFSPDGINGIAIELLYSDINDPVHGIEVIMPGFDENVGDAPFHPAFLDFIADFHVLRYMDWITTNNSPVVSWDDRTPLDYYTQATPTGVSYEYLVQLANTSQKDIWVCIPHMANDDYITQLATFLHNELDDGLKVYIEYSNEVWNGIFEQHYYAAEQGLALGYSGENWERAWQYYSKRCADIFYLFEQVYGTNSDSIVKVVASQAANEWISNYILTKFEDPQYNPYGVTADALSIAPYFGGEVGDDIGDEGLIETISLDQILDRLDESMETSKDWILAQKTVADDHGLELSCYEGGQHMVAYGYLNNETLTQKLTDANRHPRMEDIYCEYLDFWYDNVPNGLFVNFSSISAFSRWGSWGIKEYTGQADEDAPKYLAFKNCVFNVVLAVDLEPFSVEKQLDNALINWSTAKEDDLSYFEVQRSFDGRTFDALARITSKVGEGIHHYSFVDEDPFSTINYYRLKMVDYNGSFQYTDIRSVVFDSTDGNVFYPNPASDYIFINEEYAKVTFSIRIYNVSGQLIKTINANENKINISDLLSGVYFVEYNVGNQYYHQKLIVR